MEGQGRSLPGRSQRRQRCSYTLSERYEQVMDVVRSSLTKSYGLTDAELINCAGT